MAIFNTKMTQRPKGRSLELSEWSTRYDTSRIRAGSQSAPILFNFPTNILDSFKASKNKDPQAVVGDLSLYIYPKPAPERISECGSPDHQFRCTSKQV